MARTDLEKHGESSILNKMVGVTKGRRISEIKGSNRQIEVLNNIFIKLKTDYPKLYERVALLHKDLLEYSNQYLYQGPVLRAGR